MDLKIGLNATCFNDRPSGARQRFTGIYGELIRRLPNAEFVIYEPKDCRVGSWFGDAPNVSVRQTTIPSEGRLSKIRGLRYLKEVVQREKFDIFEGFNLPLVGIENERTLLTIHDIRGLRSERLGLGRVLYKHVLTKSLQAAGRVITVSESMKSEILSFDPNASVSVVYNGLRGDSFDQITESELLSVRRKFALPDQFILAVGHLEKRKNYRGLVDAIARIRERGYPHSLLIVGNDSGERTVIENRIGSLGLSNEVKILSGISELELRCVYKLCRLFIFPSLYEGFGIPILEAMAAGCPMVLSDIPVFREITEQQSIYFTGNDVDSMTLAIERVLSSDPERTRLIKYGYHRVLDFKFENLASQIAQIYTSLM